jgi:hypothetical protein
LPEWHGLQIRASRGAQQPEGEIVPRMQSIMFIFAPFKIQPALVTRQAHHVTDVAEL